jgi:hypothetical protein
VILTSVGYGDIVPLHSFAHSSLANVEAIIGQLYPATLLARLVTLELGADPAHKAAPSIGCSVRYGSVRRFLLIDVALIL